jgi:hypothetical protein
MRKYDFKKAWEIKSHLNREYLKEIMLDNEKDGSYCSSTIFKIV